MKTAVAWRGVVAAGCVTVACCAMGSACAQGANGNAANGNAANGSAANGNAANGNAANGNAANGNAANGNAANGNTANGNTASVNTASATGNTANGSARVPALASEIGHSTRNWLDLQRSGAAAAPALPMLGEEAGFAYQRYMDSFRTKIPASFGSSLNGGGNLLHVDYTNVGGASQN
ncbi:DUF3613 domain-containing protein [Paraburkholderia phymatum]|uniref:DUF3613 domain-containing protein n=1 Tax=Paraburkholderia phymatum TaxID=148447 RepID=UPI003181F896